METNEPQIPMPADPLIERMKNTFFFEYFPVQEYKAGVIFMSTKDIYNLMQNLYPNEIAYSAADVATWMHEKGFQFMKRKELVYEWMLLPQE